MAALEYRITLSTSLWCLQGPESCYRSGTKEVLAEVASEENQHCLERQVGLVSSDGHKSNASTGKKGQLTFTD